MIIRLIFISMCLFWLGFIWHWTTLMCVSTGIFAGSILYCVFEIIRPKEDEHDE